MIPLGKIIAEELANPGMKNLQARLLQAMFMMERYRRVDAGDGEVVAEVGECDVSMPAIVELADALRDFIRTHPDHPDVSSAIWALGKLRAPTDIPLFEAVVSHGSGYAEAARDQALCALESLTA